VTATDRNSPPVAGLRISIARSARGGSTLGSSARGSSGAAVATGRGGSRTSGSAASSAPATMSGNHRASF